MKFALTAAALVVFGVFISTAPPAPYLGDSGEIIASAYTLGIGHPPGYSLNMLISKIFTFIPAGDPGLAMNFMAAFFGALVFLAVYGLINYLLIHYFTPKKPLYYSLVAMCFSLVFIFSYQFWFNANQAKGSIYILTLLAQAGALYYAFRYVFEGEKEDFLMAMYLAGALPVLHQSASLTSFFIVIILSVLCLRRNPGLLTGGMLLFILSAVTPYLYLLIRQAASPVVWWGEIKTPAQILNHVLRKVYLEGQLIPINRDIFMFKLNAIISQFVYSYKAGTAFLGVGLLFMALKKPKFFFVTGIFLTLNIAALILLTRNSMAPMNLYTNSPYQLFMELPCVIIMAAGAGWLLKAGGKNKVFAPAAAGVMFALPLWLLIAGYPVNDSSRKFLSYDYVNSLLAPLKPGDSVFAEEDFQVFNLMYMKYVKKKYPEINLYDRTSNFLDTSIYRNYREADVRLKFEKLKDINIAETRAKITMLLKKQAELSVIFSGKGNTYYTTPASFSDQGLSSYPYGMLYRIYKQGEKKYDAEAFLAAMVFRDYFNNNRVDVYYREVLARFLLKRAEYGAYKGRRGQYELFRDGALNIAYDSASVENLVSFMCFSYLNDFSEALNHMERAVQINPYDYAAINVLIQICLKEDQKKALYWMKYLYGITPSKETQNNLLVLMEKVNESRESLDK